MADLSNMTDEELDAFIAQEEAQVKLSNSPKTAKPQTVAELEDLMASPESQAELKRTVEAAGVKSNAALNSMTMGAGGLADRHGNAALDYFQSDGSKSYEEFLGEVTAERQGARERHPGSALSGDILGAVGTGMALGPRLAAKTATGRIGTGIGLGAAENLGMEAGKGNIESLMDAAKASGTGAAFGAGGQLLAEGLAPLLKAGARVMAPAGRQVVKQGTQLAADSLMDPVTRGSRDSIAASMDVPEGLGPRLQQNIDLMSPQGQVMGDVDPRFANETAKAASSGATAGTTNPLRTLSEARLTNKDDAAKAISSKYFAPTLDKAETVAQQKARMKPIGAEYKIMMDPRGPAGELTVERSVLDDIASDAFGSSRSGKEDALLEGILDEVANIGDASDEMMSAVDVQTLKRSIDDRLEEHVTAIASGNPSNLNKKSATKLMELKTELNAILGDKLPDYKRLSGQFAETAEFGELMDMGEKMFTASKITPSEMGAYMETLNPIQREKFAQGVLLSLQRVTKGGDVASMKSLIKNNANRYDKLKAVLPEGEVDNFLNEADTFITELDNAKRWNSSIEGRGGSMESHGPFSSRVYEAAAAASFLGGKPTSGLFAASRILDPAEGEAVRNIMDLAQSDKAGAQKMLNDLLQVNNRQRGSLVPAMAASAASSGTGSIMD